MHYINRVLRAVIGLLIVALVVSVTVGVVFRYGLRQSLHWATEVPNVLLIWIVFLGSVVAFYERRHIAFTAFADAVPVSIGRMLKIVAEIIVLGFLISLAYYGYEIVLRSMNSLSDALKIPRGYFYICVPLSAVLMAACSLENLVRLLFRSEVPR